MNRVCVNCVYSKDLEEMKTRVTFDEYIDGTGLSALLRRLPCGDGCYGNVEHPHFEPITGENASLGWDNFFMTMAYLVAMRSKDQNTHIGAVIVGEDNEVRSTGYNSFVRGLNDSVPERQERPEKYFWFEHAERNAIYNATLMGVSLKGCRMYTNGIPCADCARAIVQAGIKEVIVDKSWNDNNEKKWQESAVRSLAMFNECGVNVRYINADIIDIKKFRNGKII